MNLADHINKLFWHAVLVTIPLALVLSLLCLLPVYALLIARKEGEGDA